MLKYFSAVGKIVTDVPRVPFLNTPVGLRVSIFSVMHDGMSCVDCMFRLGILVLHSYNTLITYRANNDHIGASKAIVAYISKKGKLNSQKPHTKTPKSQQGTC